MQIDLQTADPRRSIAQMQSIFDINPDDVLSISAKTGEGVAKVLDAIVNRIPPPTGSPDRPLKARSRHRLRRLSDLSSTRRGASSGRSLNCGPAEAVRIGLEAAGGKNLEVLSPTIGRQLLELGLIDEIDLHIAPILLGDGIRLYDNPGGEQIRLHLLSGDDPTSVLNARYRPLTTQELAT